jgi:hypothetical protein
MAGDPPLDVEAELARRMLARVRQLAEDHQAGEAFAERFVAFQREMGEHDPRVKPRHVRLLDVVIRSACASPFGIFQQLLDEVLEELDEEPDGEEEGEDGR